MKIKQYICVFAAMMMLLTGCSYNGEPGSVERITTAQLIQKLDNKESFVVVFTQTTCGHCKTFMEMLDEYLPTHDITVYDVIIDLEGNRDQAVKELETLFPDFTGTPDLYYLENGEISSRFWKEYQEAGLTETTFNAWVKKHDLLSLNAEK